jgi:hypothetical protein
MNVQLSQKKNKFFWKWLLVNSISWPIGIIIAIIFSYTIVNRFYHHENNLIIGLCIGSAVGFSQWLMLKRYFKIGLSWTLAAAIGIGLPFVIIFVLYELNGKECITSGINIVDNVIIMFIGGLITGFLQYHMIKPLIRKFKWWIIISTLAWGLGGLNLIIGGLVLGLITGITLLRLFDFPVEIVDYK